MIPGDPRDATAIRAHARIGDKVTAVEQNCARRRIRHADIQHDDGILWLATACVILPHTKQPAPAGIELEIRVAVAFWREGDRLLAGTLRIQPLIGEIAEINGAAAHDVR